MGFVGVLDWSSEAHLIDFTHRPTTPQPKAPHLPSSPCFPAHLFPGSHLVCKHDVRNASHTEARIQ